MPLPTSSPPGGWIDASAASLIVGRDGLVAVGSDSRAPGGVLWWHSDDGRRWQAVPTFEPLRPEACAGPGVACTSEPNGTIVGDGQRIAALRGGAEAAAWVSSDGSTWSELRVTGDPPPAEATRAVLLPGGVLVSNGTTTWLGEASGP